MQGFYEDKLVVVTGASGLNGSYIVRALVQAGARVRAVVHKRPATEFTKLAGEVVSANLMDSSEARGVVKGAEIVMHAAGVAGGAPLAATDPGAMVAPNAVINSQVIHACSKEGVKRLGFISSIIVYPASDQPLTEDQTWSGEPPELYFGLAWVKRFSEKLCQFYQDKCGLQVAIVRPSGSYGRFDNFDENTSHVIPAILKRAMSKEPTLRVWGDGKDIRDFVHASDIAKGLMLAVEKDARCDPINIGSGIGTTTAQLAKTALDVVGSKSRLEFDLSKPTTLRTRLIDITKARRVIGYAPSVALREGIADTVEWYRGLRK